LTYTEKLISICRMPRYSTQGPFGLWLPRYHQHQLCELWMLLWRQCVGRVLVLC